MKNSKPKKLVLAYSGGLDTSYCVHFLSHQKGYQVHAVCINTGGFKRDEYGEMENKALALGASSFKMIDATEDFYKKCIKFLIFGNVLRNDTYPLSVSAERVFQAMAIQQYAEQIGATAIAHGSTAAGNDQVRFDLIFNILSPDTEIITPIRDMQLSRQAEIAYLQEHGVDWSWEKAQYSINQGLWGTSVGGAETLTSHQPLPETAFPYPLTAKESTRIELGFEKGEVVSLDGKTFAHPIALIQALDDLANTYAIGRDIHVGDTIIGIKGRVGFAAAAALIIIKAHHLLEKHNLGKWQQHWKAQLGNWYGMLLHEGQFLDPVMRNIETFLTDTQTNVTGTVYIQLHPYRFELEGISSDFDLMQSSFGSYGEMNRAWSGEEVRGFTKIMANSGKLIQAVKTVTHE